jgi:hypothetical protein
MGNGLPKVKATATRETWNAFIVKLIQLVECSIASGELGQRRYYRGRYVDGKLQENLALSHFSCALANGLAKKTAGTFQKALDSAVAQWPLNKFFTAQQSAHREQIIVRFVRDGISSGMQNANPSQLWSIQSCPKSFACTTSFGDWGDDSDIVRKAFAWEPSSSALKFSDAHSDGDVKAAIGALDQLQHCLEEEVRKHLVTETFDFGFDFNGDDIPATVREMTFPQYCAAIGDEWDRMQNDEDPARRTASCSRRPKRRSEVWRMRQKKRNFSGR